jgi:hypothetical protein
VTDLRLLTDGELVRRYQDDESHEVRRLAWIELQRRRFEGNARPSPTYVPRPRWRGGRDGRALAAGET